MATHTTKGPRFQICMRLQRTAAKSRPTWKRSNGISSRSSLPRKLTYVHAETIPLAISPGLTEWEADVNSDALVTLYEVYRFWSFVRPTLTSAEQPVSALLLGTAAGKLT